MGVEQDATISAGSLAPGDEDLPAGTHVGEYVVEAKLGEGGFGAVYKAVHPIIGKTAAVKVLNRALSSNGEMVGRFVAEARAVNQIRHRNIIDVFGFGALPDGRQYYVMELLEGSPFDKHLEQVGRMDLASALPILRGIAKALDAAHAAGIVHRDLKPENVFLVPNDDGGFSPKVIDFGIAKLLPGTKANEAATPKTRTGMQMGTPYYMSPEQCRGVGVDHRTDVYAFGVMVHRILTGTMPFDGETLMDVMMKHMTAEPPRLTSFGFPAALDAVVARMLAKDPEGRPSTVGEAVESLRRAASEASGFDPSKLPPPVATGPAGTQLAIGDAARTDLSMSAGGASSKSRSWLFVVAGIAAVALIGGAVVLATTKGRDDAITNANANANANAAPQPSASQPAPSPLHASSASATAAASAAITKIDVTFETTPKAAEIWVGDEKLGIAPGPFALDPSGPLKVTVKAPGFLPKTLDVDPKTHPKISIELSRAPAAKPVAKPISSDLESPF